LAGNPRNSCKNAVGSSTGVPLAPSNFDTCFAVLPKILPKTLDPPWRLALLLSDENGKIGQLIYRKANRWTGSPPVGRRWRIIDTGYTFAEPDEKLHQI
jgi:hypothetical protein